MRVTTCSGRSVIFALALCFLIAAGGAQAQGFDPDNCLLCHGLPWFAVQSESGAVQDFHVSRGSFANSSHGRFSCRRCHDDIDQIPHRQPVKEVDCSAACHLIDPYTGADFSHRKVALELEQSAHGPKVDGDPEQEARKPGCKDCHTNSLYDRVLPPEVESRLSACDKCHESEEFADNVRHMALHMSADQFWKSRQDFLACARCHTNNELLTDSLQIRLSDDTMVGSFLRTFHGRGFEFGDERSPVCSDCHGYHSVFGKEDSRSSVHSENLRATCSTVGCHEDATVEFATAGSMHDLYAGLKAGILIWIKRIYILLIVGTIGGMILHNALDVIAWLRHRRRRAAEMPDVELKAENGTRYLRLNRQERLSHILMFMSFTALAISGALLWLPRERLALLPDWVFQMELRAWVHRITAIALVLVSLYHIAYFVVTRRGRTLFVAVLPRPIEDLRLMLANLGFMLGLRSEKPRFRHFNYSEKMEYWAFAWGTAVMTATGVILWFEHLGSKFVVDVARLVHSLEAILAVLAIVVWHFWNVHWKPGRWPMSEAWVDGHISEEEMEEEHAGLLEDYRRSEDPGGSAVAEVLVGARRDPATHERRRMRVHFLHFLGYTFFGLITVSCVIMAWSFAQYVGAERDGEEQLIHRPLADTLWTRGHLEEALLKAEIDSDLRHARFHVAGPVVEIEDDLRRSECTICHSWLPHNKDRRLRSFLNSHGRYMSCETCHAPAATLESNGLIWADMRRDPPGNPGEPYGIRSLEEGLSGEGNLHSFIMVKDGHGGLLFDDDRSARARQHVAEREALPAEERPEFDKRAAEAFHDRITKLEEGVINCEHCHTEQDELIPWVSLGFSPERIDLLRTASIPSSVVKYEEFHLAPAY